MWRALLCYSDACRVAGAGLAPRAWFGALRAEHRVALFVRPFGLPSQAARSAPKVAAPDPHHPARCGVVCSWHCWGGLGAWRFSTAIRAAEIALAPSRARAPAARARDIRVGQAVGRW